MGGKETGEPVEIITMSSDDEESNRPLILALNVPSIADKWINMSSDEDSPLSHPAPTLPSVANKWMNMDVDANDQRSSP